MVKENVLHTFNEVVFSYKEKLNYEICWEVGKIGKYIKWCDSWSKMTKITYSLAYVNLSLGFFFGGDYKIKNSLKLKKSI